MVSSGSMLDSILSDTSGTIDYRWETITDILTVSAYAETTDTYSLALFMPAPMVPAAGNVYKVIFDGTEYEIAASILNSASYLGEVDPVTNDPVFDNYPFVLIYKAEDNYGVFGVCVPDSATHTLYIQDKIEINDTTSAPIAPSDEYIIIDPVSREMIIPPNEVFFGVFQDNDVERKKFICPRYIGDDIIDISTCYIFINYVSAKGKPGQYLCEDVSVNGDNVTFSWRISSNVLDANKDCEIRFAVQAKRMNSDGTIVNVLGTKPYTGRNYETVESTDYIAEQYADVILELLAKMDSIDDKILRAEGAADGVIDQVNAAEASAAEARAAADELRNTIDAFNEHVADSDGRYLLTAGGTMTGNINLGLNTITNVKMPQEPNEVASKKYVDAQFSSVTMTLWPSGSWTNNTQTIVNNGILPTDDVIVTPVPEFMDAYLQHGIKCMSNGVAGLTFSCTSVPTSNIAVNIMFFRR